MRPDIQEYIGVVFNAKIKAVVLIYPRLPDILYLAILFSAERRMAEILFEIKDLFVEFLLDFFWTFLHPFFEERRIGNIHSPRDFFSSATERNGPMN